MVRFDNGHWCSPHLHRAGCAEDTDVYRQIVFCVSGQPLIGEFDEDFAHAGVGAEGGLFEALAP